MVEEVGPMTRYRLKQILERDSIDPAAYELTGGHPSEVYVLEDRKSHWAVYYSERGLETGLRCFPDEDGACRHLRELLLGDPTTRSR
jgi:hypothetical protein